MLRQDPTNTWLDDGPKSPMRLRSAEDVPYFATKLRDQPPIDSFGFELPQGKHSLLRLPVPKGALHVTSSFEQAREAARQAKQYERDVAQAQEDIANQLSEEVVADLLSEMLRAEYVLTISCVRASNVPVTDLITKSDPYAMFSLKEAGDPVSRGAYLPLHSSYGASAAAAAAAAAAPAALALAVDAARKRAEAP
uniref:Uncharacterized protein n=1 Tax=Haptolina brevifila TaxID=156173 RepID=A0A7S2MQJ8_9EUKA